MINRRKLLAGAGAVAASTTLPVPAVPAASPSIFISEDITFTACPPDATPQYWIAIVHNHDGVFTLEVKPYNSGSDPIVDVVL